ncbi:hypothetical protein [Nocardia salmonicida]
MKGLLHDEVTAWLARLVGRRPGLFASELDLLLAVNASERVDFGGPHRRKP